MFSNLNPYTIAVKKYVAQALSQTYTESIDQCIDRVMHSMVTKHDTEEFMKFLAAIYSAGHKSAFEAAQKTLYEHGLKIKLVTPSIEN